MYKRSMWLVSFALIVALALVACGGDDDDDDDTAQAAPTTAAAPTSTPKAEPAAVPTPVVPKTAAPTAVPIAMLAPGATYSDILASAEIGNIDTDIFNKNRFGGVLKWVPQGSVGNLDAMMSGTAVGRGVSWHFNESLMQWDSEGTLSPDLADSWTLAEDSSGAHYTFTMRDGRSWHDGGKPLPSDVEASIVVRYLNKDDSFGPTIKDLFVSFEAVDPVALGLFVDVMAPPLVDGGAGKKEGIAELHDVGEKGLAHSFGDVFGDFEADGQVEVSPAVLERDGDVLDLDGHVERLLRRRPHAVDRHGRDAALLEVVRVDSAAAADVHDALGGVDGTDDLDDLLR